MSELGWEKVERKASVYLDGHERVDVVEYRQKEFIPTHDYHAQFQWDFSGEQPQPPKAGAVHTTPPAESDGPLLEEAAAVLTELEAIAIDANDTDKLKLAELMAGHAAFPKNSQQKTETSTHAFQEEKQNGK